MSFNFPKLKFPEVSFNLLKRLAIPWALRQLGARKFLQDRLLHVPQAALADAASQAVAIAFGPKPPALSPDQVQEFWRAVEQVQVSIAMGWIEKR